MDKIYLLDMATGVVHTLREWFAIEGEIVFESINFIEVSNEQERSQGG